MQDHIDGLYEHLFFLDEIAGQLDEEGNARTNAMRAELIQEIRELQGLGTAQVDTKLTPTTNDNWYDEQYELDTDYN
jgi:hypothetical protein